MTCREKEPADRLKALWCAVRGDSKQSHQLAGMADPGPLNAWSSQNASTMQRTDAEAQRSLQNGRRPKAECWSRPVGGLQSGNAGEIWRRKEELAGPPRRPGSCAFILRREREWQRLQETRSKQAEEGLGRGVTIGLDKRRSTSRAEKTPQKSANAGAMVDRLADGRPGGGLKRPWLVAFGQWVRASLLCSARAMGNWFRAESVGRCSVAQCEHDRVWRRVWRCALFTVSRFPSMAGPLAAAASAPAPAHAHAFHPTLASKIGLQHSALRIHPGHEHRFTPSLLPCAPSLAFEDLPAQGGRATAHPMRLAVEDWDGCP
jgi:hypothetical protein